jgi:hypothetical protein
MKIAEIFSLGYGGDGCHHEGHYGYGGYGGHGDHWGYSRSYYSGGYHGGGYHHGGNYYGGRDGLLRLHISI